MCILAHAKRSVPVFLNQRASALTSLTSLALVTSGDPE